MVQTLCSLLSLLKPVLTTALILANYRYQTPSLEPLDFFILLNFLLKYCPIFASVLLFGVLKLLFIHYLNHHEKGIVNNKARRTHKSS